MAFELKNVVPWGRNLEEYKRMFHLSDPDLDRKIISFGDGPASFNAQLRKLDRKIVSIDPIYQFSKEQLRERLQETKETVLEQMRSNADNFVWTDIKNISELERIRMGAMEQFLEDFDYGKDEGRYVYHELPDKLPLPDGSFDLGLSSHFLILYAQLGLEFHLHSINEMLRVCKEIRIFPLINLNAQKSEVLDGIVRHFEKEHMVQEEMVEYEFQKGGNKMLRIQKGLK